MEARYLNRFSKLGERSAEQIKNQDSAGKLPEHLKHAKGSLEAQRKNAADLTATAKEMITGITTHQQMMQVEMVKNIPLPTPDIMASPSAQLGYVQLTMRFLQAGMLHFMETAHGATSRVKVLEKTLADLAVSDEEVDIIGELQPIDLETLEEAHRKISIPSPPESVTSSPEPKERKDSTPQSGLPKVDQKPSPTMQTKNNMRPGSQSNFRKN